MCQKLGLERKGVMHSDQKTRFSVKGKPAYHYCAVSSFSEYTVVHSGCAVKVGLTVPMDRVCLLSCGVSAGKSSGSELQISESSCVSLSVCRNQCLSYLAWLHFYGNLIIPLCSWFHL